ncbi:MAG: arginine--tRNA ligase [Bacteroidota bacterium]
MQVAYELKRSIVDGLKANYAIDVPLEKIILSPTEKNFEGNYTFTTFPLKSQLNVSPPSIAEKLGAYLIEKNDLVAHYQVVKGFLNLTLSDKGWIAMAKQAVDDLQTEWVKTNERIVVEFSQPNTNKPLHLGHLRNNFLGTSLSNILEATGHTVDRINIMNDRGIHICKSMVAYQRFGENRTPTSEGMKGDHFVGHYYVLFEKAYQEEIKTLTQKLGDVERAKREAPIMVLAQKTLEKWEAGDTEVVALWKRMNEWVIAGFEVTYKRTDTTFDKVYYESDTYLLGKKVVNEGLERGILKKKKDGSVWVDLEEKKLGEKLVLRSNGTTVYITQDMGAIDERHETFNFDKHIYVVGSEQERHFEVLFEIMKKLGRTYAHKLYHLSYGMVDLPSGKMKSREGTTVDADTLIDEMVATAKETTQTLGKVAGLGEKEAEALYEILGVGAIKYFLLRVNPKKRLLFNPKESIDFQGNTASFIQYTHARICTMLQKAKWQEKRDMQSDIPWHEAEKGVIFQLGRYQESLENASNMYNPACLVDYVYQLAKAYNHFYAILPIMHAEDEKMKVRRLYLSSVTALALKKSMALLGIEVPQKM